jgi:hypothetical protein
VKLLRLTAIFSYIYMIFTIITGAFNDDSADTPDFPGELHIVEGVVAILQVTLQGPAL